MLAIPMMGNTVGDVSLLENIRNYLMHDKMRCLLDIQVAWQVGELI